MKRITLVLLLLATGCASTTSRLADAQTMLEYHQARYMRECANGTSTTADCIRYGVAVNTLDDAIKDAAVALDGGAIPKSAKERLARSMAAVETAKP